MMNKNSFFNLKKQQHGGMLVELMMSIALAAIIIPFVFRYQQNAVSRARNVAVTKQIEIVQNALERYIIENKNELMKPLGKNVYRVKISELKDYGLPEYIADTYKNDYQLRVLKSADRKNKSTLQGIIILNDDSITPMRTREIVNLGGGKIGFIEGNSTYGGFGAFHSSTKDFDFNKNKGLVGTTSVKRGNTEYLWRLPSENKADSTMLSHLNLDGHDITKIRFLDSSKAQFEEKLSVEKIATNTLSFTNRATIDAVYATNTAVVYGALTSDSRGFNIQDTLTLSDSGRFSSFYTNDLYVNTLTLNGFSVSSDSGKDTMLKVIGDMDLVLGHVNAEYVSVGYTGSITPRLSVTDKIQDPKDSSFYWDVKSKKARFVDLMLPELSRMANNVLSFESKQGTEATTIFSGVVTNSNATVGDYINALNEIQNRVRAKFQMLKL